MSQNKLSTDMNENSLLICKYLEATEDLQAVWQDSGQFGILQKADGKIIEFALNHVEEVISRLDTDGQGFLQVNFHTGTKILITEKLIGFKPKTSLSLDMDKLPKVVTTPDLISVVEAIEESMFNFESHHAVDEVEMLKQVFDSVLGGGEAVGFNLSAEKNWISRLIKSRHQASA